MICRWQADHFFANAEDDAKNVTIQSVYFVFVCGDAVSYQHFAFEYLCCGEYLRWLMVVGGKELWTEEQDGSLATMSQIYLQVCDLAFNFLHPSITFMDLIRHLYVGWVEVLYETPFHHKV